MKPKANRFLRSLPLLSAVIVAFSATHAAAATYTWTQTAGGTQQWETDANWLGGTAPTPDAGDTVDFSTVNIANTTLNLNADRTATTWKFSDTSGGENWTVNEGVAGSKLVLAGTSPTIEIVRNTTTVNAVVDGSAGLKKSGAGTLVLTNANTYTGTTTISGGTLQLNTNAGSLDSTSALTFSVVGGTFNMNNTGAAGSRSQDLGALTFSAGDGTVLQTRTAAQNQVLTFSSLAARAVGATGNLALSSGTAGTTNGFVLTGVTADSFINKGIFFGTSSAQFDHYAWYDGAGFVRAMAYGSDSGAVTSGATTTLASATHQQITGAISAQETATFSTLKINGANNVTLAADQTVTVDGILKAGNNTSIITGGTGIQAANNAELVIRTDRGSDNVTLNSSILANGTNALTKSGAGTLQLGAANYHTGGTTLNAGTLNLRNNAALGPGTFTINGGTLGDGGATFTSSTNNEIVINASFSKPDTVGRVINLGTGDVTLNAPITISISAHPIQFGGTITGPGGLNALDITPSGGNNSQVILDAGITLRDTQTVTTIGSAGRLTLNGILSDGGNGYGFTVNGSGSTGGVTLGNVTHTFTGPISLQNNGGLVVLGNISPSSITVGSGSTLQLGNADLGTTGTISGSTTLENNGTFRIGENRTLVQGTDFPSLITGTGGLTRGNHGTTVLNAQNTFTGSVTVSGNSGGFAIGADTIGTVGSITSGPLGRGTLVMNSQSVFSDGATPRTILNPVTFGGSSTLGNATNNGKLTFEAPWTLNGNYTITTASAVEYNNDLNASTRNLTKGGSARLDLNGATTLANLTVTGGGTLGVGSGGSLSVVGSALNVAVSSSGTLDVSASESFTANVGNFLVGTGGSDNSTGFAYLGLDNDITAATTVRVGANGTNEKGTLTTAADSTTIIRTPIMTVGGIGALGQGTVTHGDGAELTLEGLDGGRAQLVIGRNTSSGNSGNWSYNGNVDLSAGTASLSLSSLEVGQMTATGTGVYRGIGTLTMSDNAANHLDISGTGSVVKIGDNASSQNNTVGTVTIGNLDATSSITSTDDGTAVLIANKGGSGTVSGTLNLNGGTMTITTAGAAIAGGGGTSTLNLSGGATLIAGAASTNWISGLTTATIGSGGATIDTNGFDLGISQAFSGAGGLTKDGAGTLTLGGVNTYTGNTVVSDGELVLADNAGLSFVVTDVDSNKVTGAAAATLEGDFVINTAAVTLAEGSWVLVDTGSMTFTSTFTVAGGWSESSDVWTLVDGDDTWKFSEATGTLYLNQDPPSGSDYDDWDDEYPSADLSDPNADYDGDGLSNFHEYAFGLDPTSGASVTSIIDVSDLKTLGQFTYTRRAGSGLTYTVLTSTDLENWGPVDVTEDTPVPSMEVIGAESVLVELNDLPTEDNLFLRVQAE